MSRMRLSTVFELLLIFIFIAFAASRHVGGRKTALRKGALKQAEGVINPYCSCTALSCNCCRDFTFPIVSVKGPGCAAITYKNGDVLRLTMSFGDRVLRNITLVGKRPKPVCMGLPGGLSKFCGRLYNIERDGDKVRACLALELRALDDVEAALRLSCFKFGPDGVKLEPGQPIPVTKPADEDDDDDDYDLDDDDDDIDDDDDDDEDNDVDSGDYTGFGALSDELLDSFFGTGGGDTTTNKKKRPPTTVRPIEVITKSTEPPKEAAELSTSTPQAFSELTTRKTETTLQNHVTEEAIKEEDDDGEKAVMEESATTEGAVMTASESVTSETTLAEDESTEVAQRDALEQEEEGEEEEDDDEDENDDEDQSDEASAQKTAQSESDEAHDDDDDDDDEDDEDESAEKKDDDDDDMNILESLMDVVDGPEKKKEEERRRVDRMFPGLGALLRPSPRTPAMEANFPPVRSARAHRRMRLPPLPSLTQVQYL